MQESADTTTSCGRLVFHVFGALAEFEKEMIRERTMAGLKAAGARGPQSGSPRKLSHQQINIAKKLMDDKETDALEITRTMNVSGSTLYRCQTIEKAENNNSR